MPIKDEVAALMLGEIDELTNRLDDIVASSNTKLTEGAAAVVAAIASLPAASDKEAARAAAAAISGVADRLAIITAEAAQKLAGIEAKAQEHRDRTKSYIWAVGLILATALVAGGGMYAIKAGMDSQLIANATIASAKATETITNAQITTNNAIKNAESVEKAKAAAIIAESEALADKRISLLENQLKESKESHSLFPDWLWYTFIGIGVATGFGLYALLDRMLNG